VPVCIPAFPSETERLATLITAPEGAKNDDTGGFPTQV
jgi:hypothetical protein